MAFQRGFRTIKLYFMIGQPTETIEDAQAIAHLANRVMALGRRHHGKRAKVNVTVSTFIPKPFTPFQWHPQDRSDAIRAKQQACFDIARDRNIHLMWHDPQESHIEALLALGDRRVGRAIKDAWERGLSLRRPGWNTSNPDRWYESIEARRPGPGLVHPPPARPRRAAALGPGGHLRQQAPCCSANTNALWPKGPRNRPAPASRTDLHRPVKITGAGRGKWVPPA